MCDKAKWSFPVLRSGVVLRTRERAPSCSVVCGPEEDSWTRSLTVSLLNEASRRPEKPGRAECGRGRVPTGGWTARCPEGRLEDRSETGVLFRGAARGRQGKAVAVRLHVALPGGRAGRAAERRQEGPARRPRVGGCGAAREDGRSPRCPRTTIL